MAAPQPRQAADLLQLLTRAERLLARRLAPILGAEGQSLDAWRVLSLLADGAGHPMTEIAERACLPPGTLTKLVDHLVDTNVVYRRVDDVDRRRIRAYLTPRGRSLYQRIDRALQASLASLPVAEADLELLRDLLVRLADGVALGSPRLPAAR
jgi:DNA-binding MarR family transcriptional regulator